MAGIIPQPSSNKGAVAAPNAFGAPPNNSNRQPLDRNNWFQTNDATPVNNLQSPLALTTTIVPLIVPTNATQIRIIADASIKVSERATMDQYLTVPANSAMTFDTARQAIVYVSAATTANLSFAFITM